MNMKMSIIFLVAVIAVVLFATSGCTSYSNNDDHDYVTVSDTKTELVIGEEKDGKSH